MPKITKYRILLGKGKVPYYISYRSKTRARIQAEILKRRLKENFVIRKERQEKWVKKK